MPTRDEKQFLAFENYRETEKMAKKSIFSIFLLVPPGIPAALAKIGQHLQQFEKKKDIQKNRWVP